MTICIRALLGALSLALTGCEMQMGPMMRGQAPPANFASNAERIYFTATSASEHPIAPRGGGMHVRMHGASCASCHGADRQGGVRMMPRFWVVAPPLTPQALLGDEHGARPGHAEHECYTEATLRRAISEGIDPSGRRLDEAMPRWLMNEEDLHELTDYLLGTAGGGHVHATS